MPIDHVLKLYSESFRSPYLHYGFWDEPDQVNTDNLTLNDMVAAQQRYIEHLASFIPEDVKTILDVGAGIGGNSSFLLTKGYSQLKLYHLMITKKKYLLKNIMVKFLFTEQSLKILNRKSSMTLYLKVKVRVIFKLNLDGR